MTIPERSIITITTCFFSTLALLVACDDKKATDPCCTFSDLPVTAKADPDQGALQVHGSTPAYYFVFDEGGEQINFQTLNKVLPLDPGHYQVKVNNSTHAVEIKAGILAKCSTGTLIIGGQTSDYYYVTDSLNEQLTFSPLGKATSLFPSTVKVKVNDTEAKVQVRLNEVTEIQTGTLVVHGSTEEYYYVLDAMNKQLNFKSLEKPLAFLPGSYMVKVNNTSMRADVAAGKVTELGTGTLLVKGLTSEYYYVQDTLGNALNFQSLNKPLSFFPGNVKVKVNNTVSNATIAEGKVSEYATGSLILTGGGTQYYYVLDETGNQLNFNSLNKSLSFFPSEYVVKLGESTRKATVVPGQLTSITAFEDAAHSVSSP